MLACFSSWHAAGVLHLPLLILWKDKLEPVVFVRDFL